MPAISSAQFVLEESPAKGSPDPNRTLWISEAGGLSQFGAFIEVPQPGSRSSLKHWHSLEDELVYVLDGEITLVEGDLVSQLRAGDAATFKASVPVGHFLENRGSAASRCLVAGTRAPVDHITYPDNGIIEAIGQRLPFEEPYWSGEHAAVDSEEEKDVYPLPFHPLELGEETLKDRFGYQLEGFIDPSLLKPESIPLIRYKRSRSSWWKF